MTLCQTLLAGDWPYTEEKVCFWDRERLRLLLYNLKHTKCIPLVLALKKVEQSQFSEVIHIIEKFFFRYKLICNMHITSLTNIYNKYSKILRSSAADFSIKRLKMDLAELGRNKADDEVFKSNLKNLLYRSKGSNYVIKYFLFTIDYYWPQIKHDSGHKTHKDKDRATGFDGFSIEHIHPRSLKNPDCEDLKDTLGNLTLLTRKANELCKDKTLEMKVEHYKSSQFVINLEIIKNEKWSAHAIKDRTNLLVEKATTVFWPFE